MSNLSPFENQYFSQLDDVQLWCAFKSGNEKALIFLYRQHYQPLYRYGVKLCGDQALAKDCIHDLFTHLWLHREKNTQVNHIRAYLLKSLRWQLGKKVQKDRRLVDFEKRPVSDAELEFSYESLLVHEQTDRERREKLAATLRKLSRRQQEVIYLRFYNDLSYEQIAEVMSLKYQSARNLVHEAVKVLRECITFDFTVIILLLQGFF